MFNNNYWRELLLRLFLFSWLLLYWRRANWLVNRGFHPVDSFPACDPVFLRQLDTFWLTPFWNSTQSLDQRLFALTCTFDNPSFSTNFPAFIALRLSTAWLSYLPIWSYWWRKFSTSSSKSFVFRSASSSISTSSNSWCTSTTTSFWNSTQSLDRRLFPLNRHLRPSFLPRQFSSKSSLNYITYNRVKIV